MCDTRDLGIKWPHWYAMIFEGEVRLDMRCVCPKDVRKMLVQQARPGQFTGRSGQRGTNAKNEKRKFGWSQLWLCCARRRTKSGLKNIEMLSENGFWKEAGSRKDSSTLFGRMKKSAKPATKRKEQKNTGFTTVQNVEHMALKWLKSSLPWPLSVGQKEFGQEHGVTS